MCCKKDCRGLYRCEQFKGLSIKERIILVKQNEICPNCLRYASHKVEECNFSNCKTCLLRHNTLLCFQANGSDETNTGENTLSTTTMHYPSNKEFKNQVILSTAIIFVTDKSDNKISARVLLDPGSQSNYITQNMFNKLGLHCKSIDIKVAGINSNESLIHSYANLVVKSRFNNFTIKSQFLIINNITNKLPMNSLSPKAIQIPPDINLADPNFYQSANIDILIGAEWYFDILLKTQ